MQAGPAPTPQTTPKAPFLSYESFDHFSHEVFADLMQAAKISNQLPSTDDFAYYNSFAPFKSKMRSLSHRLLEMTQHIISHEDASGQLIVNDTEDPDDVHYRFESVVEMVDTLLEQIDEYVDETEGTVSKAKQVVFNTTTSVRSNTTGSQPSANMHIIGGTNILRPQLKFDDPIDNTNTPWIPHQYREKFSPEELEEKAGVHPFQNEILGFEYLPHQIELSKEQKYNSLEETPFTWVDTKSELEKLARSLEKVQEFAVDLEHHSYRSFQGFTCLMQISTRTEDYIIDTLSLRSQMHILSTSFHNPEIVKIFHGSDWDVLWLQRDFGLYVINMFDTGQAARVLELNSFSLAFLLKSYCDITVDKKYQLADWRVRPIPEEMMKYAREDTHYLLYVYDKVKNELIEKSNESKNLVYACLQRSRELSLLQFEKEITNENSHLNLYHSFNYVFNTQQMRVFAALYIWRDTVARREDESVRYVLPNHMMFLIAETLPVDTPSLLGCCSPVPPLLRLGAEDVVGIIKEAMLDPVASASSSGTSSLLANAQSAGSKWANDYRPILHRNYLSGRFDSSISSLVPENYKQQQSQQGTRVEGRNDGQQYQGRSKTDNWLGRYGSGEENAVLSKDELYETAGWVNPLGSKRTAVCAQINQSFNASAPLTTSLFKPVYDDGEEIDEEAKNIVEGINATLASSSLFPTVMFPVVDENNNNNNVNQNNTLEMVTSPKSGLGDVPRSMAEIYKISNKNRKKNKKKRRMNDDKTVGTVKQENVNTNPSNTTTTTQKKDPSNIFSPVKFTEDSEDEVSVASDGTNMQTGSRKKQKVKDMSNEEFLGSIGWKEGQKSKQEPTSAGRGQSRRNNNNNNNNNAKGTGRGNESKVTRWQEKDGTQFVPYDYSTAEVKISKSNLNANSNSFSPYSEPSRGRGRGKKLTMHPKSGAKSQTFGRGNSRGGQGRGSWKG